MIATSPSMRGWPMVKTLSSCLGSSKPVKLNANQAKHAIISQRPKKRGRKCDLYTRRPNGRSHRPPQDRVGQAKIRERARWRNNQRIPTVVVPFLQSASCFLLPCFFARRTSEVLGMELPRSGGNGL